ncbi:MAG: hypothetical protein NTW50_00390 [Candidatus Berkelbacteria bacterium]|nr:hypothetical protein [Candidatus Berkelbacteria bacterium]
MAEGTSASPEEEKAAQQDLIDEHMGDSKFVDFLTGAEKGSLDLTSLKDERILKFIEVYDQIESTSDQITEILQNRLFEGLNLNEVSNDAKKQIKEFLLEKAKEACPLSANISRRFENIRKRQLK